jgi:hypothetical protein
MNAGNTKRGRKEGSMKERKGGNREGKQEVRKVWKRKGGKVVNSREGMWETGRRVCGKQEGGYVGTGRKGM